MNVQAQFEDELRRRGFSFSIDAESGRHAVWIGDGARGRMLISLDNLLRDVASDGDVGRVARFVDAIAASADDPHTVLSPDRLFWCLEPNDYEVCADYRIAISNCVDRVLAYLSDDGKYITWVTSSMLDSLGLSQEHAEARSFTNLGLALSEASLDVQDIDGVRLGLIGTTLPFKSSLILAPNLREVVEATLGWPLMAVVPDRNFLFLWAARHTNFAQRVGRVVVDEYSKSSYPISTEVYEITDSSIRAIGEFPK